MSHPSEFQPPMFPIPSAADFSLNNDFDVCTHTAANQGQANSFPIDPFNPPPPLNNGFDVYTETPTKSGMPNNFPNGPFNPPPLNNGFDAYNDTQANHGKPNNFPNGPFPNFPPIPKTPVNLAQNPLSSNLGGQYFKTRLCAKYQQGLCAYGQNCTFAHGHHELRFLPTDQQEKVGCEGLIGNSSGQQKITKHGICRKFYNGEECLYGDGCIFLHQKPLGEMQNSLAMKVKTAANSEQSTGVNVNGSHHLEDNKNATSYGDINETSQRPALWKTKMCIKWETTGYCPFGDKCNFAHGYDELEKFGGCTDVGSVNVAKAPVRPLPDIPGDERSPTQPDSQPQNEQPNSLLKWKRPRKIIGIYGDWID